MGAACSAPSLLVIVRELVNVGHKDFLLMPCICFQAIQISPNGLRDGNMGDDEPFDSA